MPTGVSVFLDTSALFAGIWSAKGGGRMILKLGEAGAIRLLVSPQVLDEIESVLRRKAPDMLGLLALLLDHSGVEVVSSPIPESVQDSQVLTGHPGDAQVLAAAWAAGADYFVTLDRKHFLDNPALRSVAPFPIGTPGDFLTWYRGQLTTDCAILVPLPGNRPVSKLNGALPATRPYPGQAAVRQEIHTELEEHISQG